MEFKTAIVIGNGFDLDYRLKTNYKDFVKDPFFPNNELATFIQENYKVKGWADLEADIKEYALAEIYSSIPQFLTDYEEMKRALFSFLNKVEPRDIVDRPHNPFARHLFKGASDYVVLDFNYTRIVPYSWTNGAHGSGIVNPDENRYISVHGTLKDNNIIFGIEDVNLPKELSSLLKSSAENYVRKSVVELLCHAQQVIIWGHSLGMSDKDYFKAYFNQIMTDKTNRKKIVIVTCNEESTIRIKENIGKILDCDYRLLEDTHTLKFIQTNGLTEKRYDEHIRDIWGW